MRDPTGLEELPSAKGLPIGTTGLEITSVATGIRVVLGTVGGGEEYTHDHHTFEKLASYLLNGPKDPKDALVDDLKKLLDKLGTSGQAVIDTIENLIPSANFVKLDVAYIRVEIYAVITGTKKEVRNGYGPFGLLPCENYWYTTSTLPYTDEVKLYAKQSPQFSGSRGLSSSRDQELFIRDVETLFTAMYRELTSKPIDAWSIIHGATNGKADYVVNKWK